MIGDFYQAVRLNEIEIIVKQSQKLLFVWIRGQCLSLGGSSTWLSSQSPDHLSRSQVGKCACVVVGRTTHGHTHCHCGEAGWLWRQSSCASVWNEGIRWNSAFHGSRDNTTQWRRVIHRKGHHWKRKRVFFMSPCRVLCVCVWRPPVYTAVLDSRRRRFFILSVGPQLSVNSPPPFNCTL